MRIAFFHIGKDISRANIFCKSARRAFGNNIEIIQISDLETPKAKEVEKVFRSKQFKKNKIMYWRMVGYRDLLKLEPEPTVFFDTDMLVMQKFQINFEKGPFLCRRSYDREKVLQDHAYLNQSVKILFKEHKDKKLGELYPFVGCFYADKNCLFLSEAIKAYDSLDEHYQFWFGDQIALREAAKVLPFSTLPESIVACSHSKYIPRQKNAIAVHFKGAGNKSLMEKIFFEMSAGSP